MPLVEARRYTPAPLHIGGHLQTILPSAFRRVRGVTYRRERLELPDGDFVDMDWASAVPNSSSKRAQRVVVLSHGLEGDSHRHYILALAKLFTRHGWDALAWNCRSCSGEMNRLPRLYHHGATEDLAAVVQFAIRQRKYTQVALVGVSLGGNLTLKYLGENGDSLPPEVIGGVGISVPADLVAGEEILALPDRRIYQQRFLKKLRPKVEVMAQRVPGISLTGYDQIKRFREFDDRYTAPLHGFASALDYYTRVSSNQFVERITRPALLLSARNDPFLAPSCFPEAIALRHRSFYVEITEQGGHVGFMQLAKEFSYSELRALEFITSIEVT
jgi:uncharacterized protein